jgi:hypothetical protein
MDNSLRSIVESQVGRVRRRLFARSLAHSLALCWAVSLVLIAAWFLLRPLLFAGADETLRWAVAGGILGLGSIVGIALGWTRTPSLVASALAMDGQFSLRERVTTLLTLPPDLAASPAGQALLADVGPRVEKLHVASGFPVLPSWRTGVMPLGAMLLAVTACLMDPVLSTLRFPSLSAAQTVEQKVNAEEVQKQIDNLRKVANENKNSEAEKSKEMQELLEEWDKLVNKPIDPNNADQVRDHVAEMRTLEQKMKERAHELKAQAQKNDALKKLLEQLNEDGKKLKEGPAKDFEDALMKGNFAKAKDVLDKLAKQLQNRELTPQQQKELAEQFKQLQEKVQRALEKDEKLKQLKKDFEQGKITKEQLDREMEKMGGKELQELSNLIGQCKECLGQDPGEAGAALAKMAKQFEQAELSEQELQEILDNMAALNEAALALGDALGEGDENGMNGGGPPGARRPIDPNDPNSKIINQRQKAQVDPNSQQRITGFMPGGNFNKIPAKELQGAFRQAQQQAPDAIERQNIPEDAAGIARGYFQKLGGQK